MNSSNTILIDNLDQWQDFASANADALIEAYGSVETALQHACDGGLQLGGGAAPLMTIVFVD